MDIYEPTKEEQEAYDMSSRGYIGFIKPKVELYVQPKDRWSYKRFKAAQKLGIDESELADEPDNLAEDPEQAWA